MSAIDDDGFHGTEGRQPARPPLAGLPSAALIETFVRDQQAAAAAVLAACDAITRALDAAVPRLQAGGRLIYVGAGTSGRLGLLDAVELNPTFGWPRDRAPALLAGGRRAVFRAVEGAEDDGKRGAADIDGLVPAPADVAIGLSASGSTAYVLGAVTAARAAGALTIGIANNAGAPLLARAEIGVLLETGAEVISGSTRLKAGTAQKIALNALSSALMVRLNKVYGDLMVDLQAGNRKLHARALRLTRAATGSDDATARAALDACGWRVKTAIVMLRGGVDAARAEARLAAVDGNVDAALR
jgi:N-acetylmuramic acid 6-phosphate etherase